MTLQMDLRMDGSISFHAFSSKKHEDNKRPTDHGSLDHLSKTATADTQI